MSIGRAGSTPASATMLETKEMYRIVEKVRKIPSPWIGIIKHGGHDVLVFRHENDWWLQHFGDKEYWVCASKYWPKNGR